MPDYQQVNPDWIREALNAGFDHEAVPYQQGTIETSIHAMRFTEHQGKKLQPHQSMLKAYFIARSYARAKKAGRQHDPGDLTPWFHQAFNAWLQDIQQQPNAKEPEPNDPKTFPRRINYGPEPQGSPDFSYELSQALTQAIIGGYEDEGQLDPQAKTQRMKAIIPYLGENPPPYALLITGYFQSRAAAIAKRLERDPYEEPDRWFAQAAVNYREEVTLNIAENQG